MTYVKKQMHAFNQIVTVVDLALFGFIIAMFVLVAIGRSKTKIREPWRMCPKCRSMTEPHCFASNGLCHECCREEMEKFTNWL